MTLLFLETSSTLTFNSEVVSRSAQPDVVTAFPPVHQQASLPITEIAQQVTVRIVGNPGLGSGVIISQSGNTYTVITNEHVVTNSWDGQYRILTADGLMHPAQKLNTQRFGNLDVAMVQFSSINAYRVVELGNSRQLSIHEPVYASGYPNWNWMNANTPESTRNWGVRAYKLTQGSVGMILTQRSLHRGYQLGYTNDVEDGMSGGPVLDSQGKLVGINGRLKYPFYGISAFRFMDGSQPSQELFQQMEALSWAIPINNFLNQINFAVTEKLQ